MTELDELLAKIYQEPTIHDNLINEFYTLFLRTSFFMPIDPDFKATAEEPFRPLMSQHADHYFIVIFDTLERMQCWAGDDASTLQHVKILGSHLVKALGENIFLCLNFGTAYYKEFAPDEVTRLQQIVAKTETLLKRHAKVQ